jgi:hypothetical protein
MYSCFVEKNKPKMCNKTIIIIIIIVFFVANTFQIQPFHKDWRSRQMWLFVFMPGA